MKHNKTITLALTAIVLAVVASGTASAATTSYYLGDSTVSFYYGPSNYYDDSASTGLLNVFTEDFVSWHVKMYNRCGHDVSTLRGAAGINRNNAYDTSGLYGNNQGQSLSTGQKIDTDHAAKVREAGNYWIMDWHSYMDGSRSYTITWTYNEVSHCKNFVSTD